MASPKVQYDPNLMKEHAQKMQWLYRRRKMAVLVTFPGMLAYMFFLTRPREQAFVKYLADRRYYELEFDRMFPPVEQTMAVVGAGAAKESGLADLTPDLQKLRGVASGTEVAKVSGVGNHGTRKVVQNRFVTSAADAGQRFSSGTPLGDNKSTLMSEQLNAAVANEKRPAVAASRAQFSQSTPPFYLAYAATQALMLYTQDRQFMNSSGAFSSSHPKVDQAALPEPLPFSRYPQFAADRSVRVAFDDWLFFSRGVVEHLNAATGDVIAKKTFLGVCGQIWKEI